MVEQAKIFVCRALRNRRTDPTLLVITGNNGNGKTTVGSGCFTCFAQWSIDAYCNGWWRTDAPKAVCLEWSELAGTKPEERDGAWRDCIEADFLVLNDVGSEPNEMKSGVAGENLRLMLEARLGRFTIITMNFHPEDWVGKWDARVEDRLYRRAQLIELPTAPSWWRAKGKS